MLQGEDIDEWSGKLGKYQELFLLHIMYVSTLAFVRLIVLHVAVICTRDG